MVRTSCTMSLLFFSHPVCILHGLCPFFVCCLVYLNALGSGVDRCLSSITRTVDACSSEINKTPQGRPFLCRVIFFILSFIWYLLRKVHGGGRGSPIDMGLVHSRLDHLFLPSSSSLWILVSTLVQSNKVTIKWEMSKFTSDKNMLENIGDLFVKCMQQVTKGHLYHLLGVSDYYYIPVHGKTALLSSHMGCSRDKIRLTLVLRPSNKTIFIVRGDVKIPFL